MEGKVFVNIFHLLLSICTYILTTFEKIDCFFIINLTTYLKVPKKRIIKWVLFHESLNTYFQRLYLCILYIGTYFILELYYSVKQFLSHDRDIFLSTFLLNQINQKFNILLSFWSIWFHKYFLLILSLLILHWSLRFTVASSLRIYE